jgi:autotransporter-associated beta strand protein
VKRIMKRCTVLGFVLWTGLLAFVPVTLQAATYYWDVNAAATGFGTASGTWGSSAFWNTDGTGAFSGTTATSMGTGDNVNFGNGTTGLGAGTVAVTGATQGFMSMTFASGSGAILLSGGTLNLASASTITVNNTADTINVDMQGSSSLTKAGTGILYLSGANTFSGGLTNAAGKLWLRDNTMDFGSGVVFLGNGSTLNLTNVTLSTASAVSIGTATANNIINIYSNTLWDAGGGTITIGANTKNGNQLNIIDGVLTNAAVYMSGTASGQINIEGGSVFLSTLYANAGNTVQMDGGSMKMSGNMTIRNNAQFTLNDGDLVLSNPGNVAFGFLNGSSTLVINNGTLTVVNAAQAFGDGGSGTVDQSGGAVILGSGTAFGTTWNGSPKYYISGGSLVLTNGAQIRGMNSFTASGNAVVTVGVPTGNNYMQFGDSTLNPLVIITNNAQVTFASSPKISAATSGRTVLNLDGGVLTVPGFTASTGTNTVNFNGGLLAFSAGNTIAANAVSTFNIRNNGANLDTKANAVSINQNLLNAGSGGLSKTGSGTLTLGGANTYIGPTTVSAGTLKAGVASVANVSGAFGLNSAVALANVAGAKLDITGYNTQIGSLTGGGATGGNVTLGAATLTVGGDNTSPAAYAGVISSSGSPTTSLIKVGNGALLLNGVNTYSGATAVNSGTLGGTGTIAGTATVATNAFVSGGSTNSIGTFNVMNLTLQEGAGLAWNYGTATQDRVAVGSALTLPTYGVVNVMAAEGAVPSQLPTSNVLMTYNSNSGATSLDKWVVNGVTSAHVRLDGLNKRVLLIINRGTLISIM